jgi:hypothetical protein
MPGNPGELVVTTLVCFLLCTRGCGCTGRPAFPAPSLGGSFTHTSGAPRRGNAEVCLHASLRVRTPRHCERSEAIHSFFLLSSPLDRLLRGACHRAALRADPLARNAGVRCLTSLVIARSPCANASRLSQANDGEAAHPDRSSDGSSGRSLTGSNGVRSVLRACPSAISSASASPVAGALRMPQTLWPDAT